MLHSIHWNWKEIWTCSSIPNLERRFSSKSMVPVVWRSKMAGWGAQYGAVGIVSASSYIILDHLKRCQYSGVRFPESIPTDMNEPFIGVRTRSSRIRDPGRMSAVTCTRIEVAKWAYLIGVIKFTTCLYLSKAKEAFANAVKIVTSSSTSLLYELRYRYYLSPLLEIFPFFRSEQQLPIVSEISYSKAQHTCSFIQSLKVLWTIRNHDGQHNTAHCPMP